MSKKFMLVGLAALALLAVPMASAGTPTPAPSAACPAGLELCLTPSTGDCTGVWVKYGSLEACIGYCRNCVGIEARAD